MQRFFSQIVEIDHSCDVCACKSILGTHGFCLVRSSNFSFQFFLNFTYTHNLCRYHFFHQVQVNHFIKDIMKRYNNMFNMSTYLDFFPLGTSESCHVLQSCFGLHRECWLLLDCCWWNVCLLQEARDSMILSQVTLFHT